MNKTQILFLVVLMASACSTAIFEKEGKAREPNSIEEAREDAWAKIDKVACRKKGGEVRSEGMLGMPMCVVPYEDAGEICTDSTDCRGDCRADDRITNYNAPPGGCERRLSIR